MPFTQTLTDFLAPMPILQRAFALHITRPEQAMTLVTAAIGEGTVCASPRGRGWAHLVRALVGYRLIGSDLTQLEQDFVIASAALRSIGDDRGLRLANLSAAVLASKRGNWAAALAEYESLIGGFDLDSSDEENFYPYIGLSTSHVYCGNLVEGLRFGYAGLHHAQQTQSPAHEVVMCLPLGVALMAARDSDEAAMLFGTAERLCDQLDSPSLLKTVRLNRAIALRRMRRFAEAMRLVNQVLAEPAPLIGGQPFAHYAAAELHIQLDQNELAAQHLQRARELLGNGEVALLDQAKLAFLTGLLASRSNDDERAHHELSRAAALLPRVSAWRFSDRSTVYDELAAVLARQGRYYDAYNVQRRSTEEFLHNVDVLNRIRHFSMQVRTEMTRVQAELHRTAAERLDLQHEQRRLREEVERAAKEVASLREVATRDALTDLPNRRYLDEVLPNVLRMRQQTATPLALAFIDLDNFKEVNDRYGHAMGDLVLKGFGEVVGHVMRASDVVGRYGGEEFCVALVGCGPDAAATRMRALMKVFEKREFTLGERRLQGVTFSVGISVYPEDGVDLDGLLAAADRRLYEGKRAGRAAVVTSDYPLPAQVLRSAVG